MNYQTWLKLIDSKGREEFLRAYFHLAGIICARSKWEIWATEAERLQAARELGYM